MIDISASLLSSILMSVPVAGIAIAMRITKGSTVQTISTVVDSWKVAGFGLRLRRCAQME